MTAAADAWPPMCTQADLDAAVARLDQITRILQENQ